MGTEFALLNGVDVMEVKIVRIPKTDFPLRTGRTLGVSFKKYDVNTDGFVHLSILIEPQDLPFIEKYYIITELKQYMEKIDDA